MTGCVDSNLDLLPNVTVFLEFGIKDCWQCRFGLGRVI